MEFGSAAPKSLACRLAAIFKLNILHHTRNTASRENSTTRSHHRRERPFPLVRALSTIKVSIYRAFISFEDHRARIRDVWQNRTQKLVGRELIRIQMSSHGNNNNNNNDDAADASSSSSNMGRGGAQPATASYGRGVGRGAGRGRGQPRGRSCYRVRSTTTFGRNSPVLTMMKCGQMGHFVRNCPRRNNLQQAPPRGGSTAHRGRGGSLEAGHSASSPVHSTPVEAGADVKNSPVSFCPTVPLALQKLSHCLSPRFT